MFISFEGGEGSGKSTQIRRLAARLEELGKAVVLTREPGGVPEAERLRERILAGAFRSEGAEVETLVHYLARFHHLDALIRPALLAGKWVLCDRFSDSTRAYQGAGGGVSLALIEALEKGIVDQDRPDLTLVLDLPFEASRARVEARLGATQASPDRYDEEDRGFHERVRQAFLALATNNPDRYRVIDAARSEEEVEEAVWQVVESSNFRLGRGE